METFNSGAAEQPAVSGASQACHEGDRPIFWEIFAGCSRLSAHFDNANFQSLPVDHEGNDHQSEMPQLLLDLRDPSAQEVLLDRAIEQPPQVIHFAMPCGAGSRARDRKIPEHLKKRGAPEPPTSKVGFSPSWSAKPVKFPPSQGGLIQPTAQVCGAAPISLLSTSYPCGFGKP